MRFWRLDYVVRLGLLIGLTFSCCPSSALANDTLWGNWWAVLHREVPCKRGVGFFAGQTYDWSEMNFAMASWQALYDYETIWLHDAPEGLGIRLEGNLGMAGGTEFSGARFVASANFLAVYEFKPRGKAAVVPYIEGGAGLVYTDFQRSDQGFRVNFNPVAGVGLRKGSTFLTARLFHLSNAGLDHHNRGMNAIMLGIGIYLGSR